MEKKKCSIIILNFNGKNLLERFMPSILDAVKYDGGIHEVVIVDNASTDGSQEYIQKNLPSVKLIVLKNNTHMQGYNIGAEASCNEIVVILNNDIKVEKEFLQPMLQHFCDTEVFAVRPTINVVDGDVLKETRGAQIGVCFKFGFLEFLYREAKTEEERQNPAITFCASGGAGAFDRKKFLELKGFDELFAPFYWEDVDLCYRAWKRGWKVISEPRSVIYHYTHSTIGKFCSNRYVELIACRNRYLLVWKNITDWGFLLQHFICIPLRWIWSLMRLNFTSFLSFFYALKLLKAVSEKRKTEKKYFRHSDGEIFNLFSHVSGGKTR
ncbi:MAG: hypothetical protein A2W75_03070 [Nitrospinae bacterium RIFCSPLOWO2_12_39_15]|nr:MAG: hypothetical protein A2W75_03070 [Nitrospinae bacterium RIFCSPLOWO2_12_39_15]